MMVKTQEAAAGTREGDPRRVDVVLRQVPKFECLFSIWSPCFILVCESPMARKGGSARAPRVKWDVSQRSCNA